MAFRFWKRITIAPGVTLNLGKSGASLSLGPKGAHYTIGPKGRRVTTGIPGTGLFYTAKSSKSRRRAKAASPPPRPSFPARDRLTFGFFQELVTSKQEKDLVAGFRALVLDEEDRAASHFKNALHLADGACMAGFLALKKGRLEEAEEYLSAAASKFSRLGRYFKRYGISMVVSLPVTEEVSVHVTPTLRGVLLALVSIYHRLNKPREMSNALARLRKLEPGDVVVKLSVAELLLEQAASSAPGRAGRKAALKRVVRLAEGVENETPVHAALLLYKARALRELELYEAARKTASYALRRTKGRSPELLNALRYERAFDYEKMGRRIRARREWERLYAEDPAYEDVARRLGL